MGKTTGRVVRGAIFGLSIGAAAPALALSNPNDFCTGDPCVISSNKNVDHGAVLDFGTRTVILQQQLNILNQPSGAVGSFTLKAGTFRITGGGHIKGTNTGFPGGTVTIEAVNNIQFDGTTAAGDVRLSGQDAGSLTLTATNGSVTGDGRLVLIGDGTIGSGGTLDITAGADVVLTDNISMSGGTQGGGGSVNVVAAGNVSITGTLDLNGGDVGGGFLDVTSGGSTTFGIVNMSGSADSGDAGIATITAGGNVLFGGKYTGRGADNFESCGDGADIDVSADGSITLAAEMDIQGRGLDCAGGFLALDGASVFLQGLLRMGGTGVQGEGGDLDVSALTLIRQTGTVQLDGGDGGAGDALYLSDDAIEIIGNINANGRSTNSPGSSLVELDAARITISGDINASGGANASGGDVTLGACDVLVQPGADIDARGNLGLITIEGSDTVVLRGTFLAAANGGIDIEVNSKSNPPDTAGATFSPPATVIVSAVLAPCRVCDTNAQCADANPCTDDVCVPATGCTNTPRNSGPCSDGNACTANDMCVAGVCVSGPPNTCDDGNLCTLDACFPGFGCVNFPQTGACNDGDLCTVGDNCDTGSCVGTPINCGDGNPCTSDVCTAGVCSNPPNTDPCDDGNACTTNDACSGGSCLGGPPPNCADTDICTVDTCAPLVGCEHAPLPGCVDSDGDQKIDDEDECTTITWTSVPTTPPNQHPLKFRGKLSKLSAPAGEQRLLVKGLFNVASTALPIDPGVNGIHIYAADASGPLFDVSLPGGAGCGPKDGWSTVGSATQSWKYRNKTGALPPGCVPGSARGISSVLIKDARQSSKNALQFKLKAKDATLLGAPALPLTRLQISLALAAQPVPGTASPQAKAGQCAEALFTGNPIPTGSAKPFCKPKLKNAQLDGAICKGL